MPWRETYLDEVGSPSALGRVIGRLETRIEFLCAQSIKTEGMLERGQSRMDYHEREILALHRKVNRIHDGLSSIEASISKRRSRVSALLRELLEVISLKEMIGGLIVVLLALKGIMSPGDVKALVLHALGQ